MGAVPEGVDPGEGDAVGDGDAAVVLLPEAVFEDVLAGVGVGVAVPVGVADGVEDNDLRTCAR